MLIDALKAPFNSPDPSPCLQILSPESTMVVAVPCRFWYVRAISCLFVNLFILAHAHAHLTDLSYEFFRSGNMEPVLDPRTAAARRRPFASSHCNRKQSTTQRLPSSSPRQEATVNQFVHLRNHYNHVTVDLTSVVPPRHSIPASPQT
jgi:hypothetical protein